MLHPDGIEVVIKSVAAKTRYQEYEKAENADADNDKVVRYIEAANDERFMIEVRIKPTFLYYSAEGIKISTYIDGGVVNCWNFMSKPSRDLKGIEQILEKVHVSAKVGGQWAKTGFAFGELRFDDNLSADTKSLKRQRSKLGNIRITVQRGYRERRTTPIEWSSRCAATETASPRLLKDSKISHAIKLDKVETLKKPPTTVHDFTPLGGPKLGKKFIFGFHYRSRVALERLGVLTISPRNVPIADTAAVDPKEVGYQHEISAEGCPSSTPSPPPSLQLSAQPSKPQQNASEEVSDLSAKGSVDLASVLSAAVKRVADSQACLFPVPRKRAKTVDLTADSPEPDTPLVKPEPHWRSRPVSPINLPIVDLTVEQVTDGSPVKQELGAEVATDQTADRHSEELDEDDIHMELKRVELEERRLNLQQRLKKLQRARAGGG